MRFVICWKFDVFDGVLRGRKGRVREGSFPIMVGGLFDFERHHIEEEVSL